VKRRRSLTHVGGAVETSGDAALAAKLAEALDVAPAPEPRGEPGAEDDPDRAHVHGFHTYPARMHPATAAHLVRVASQRGQVVLDPFCGSGTVLVEAMIAGRRAVGTDLNPLAEKLARLKTARLDPAGREAMIAAARGVAAFAGERRERRAGATRRYPQEDAALFDPHVLLELDSIRAGVADLDAPSAVRDALALVLSSILVKLSRRASDTAAGASPRRIAAGYPARLFVKKTEELARRLATLDALVPADVPPARVTIDDATRLRTVGPSTVDAVVTSPPYAATYDYLEHHAARLRWLDLDPRAFATGEMGSRRRYRTLDAAAARAAWSRELGGALRAMARVCRKGAILVLLLADSAASGEALRAGDVVPEAADHAGLALRARASQPRPHFHGPTAAAFQSAPREEHAIALEKR
jgi:DNA modification methylase